MATNIASLFTAPEDILAAQQQQNLQRQAAISQQGQGFGVFAPLYQAGLRGIDTASQALFPTQDPRLQRATMIQGVLSKYQGQDMTDPTVLGKMSSDFASMGLAREAMTLAQDARAAQRESEKMGLEKERLGIAREEVNLKREKQEQGDITNLVTKKGDAIVQKQGKMYVQTVDDEGNVQLAPYKKSVHGAFETKSEYAAAQAASGGVVRQPIVDPRTGFTIGYIILDRQGNEIRRETFDGRPMGAGAGAPAAGGGAVPNIFQQALQERLAKEKK